MWVWPALIFQYSPTQADKSWSCMPEIEALQIWIGFGEERPHKKYAQTCVERDSGACWEILRLKECLTTIEGRSAVDVSSHEGWLRLLSHRVVPHSTNSALKQVNEVTEMLNGIEQHSINSNAVGVHVCHLSVYRCMTCLAASVVAVVGTQGRILQWSVRARSRGATATVRMTQALTVLLMHLKHIALALIRADWCSNAGNHNHNIYMYCL